jgi:ribosome-binding protein aMBF1 (putative translation factor)
VYREFGPPRPLPLPNTSSFDSFLEEMEADPDMAGRMAEARKNMAATVYGSEPITLSALRLAAGLSQAQLAKKAQTSQPHIAKIERGQNDPSTDVIARIAQALGIDEVLAFQAIRNQLATRAHSK